MVYYMREGGEVLMICFSKWENKIKVISKSEE